MDTFIKIIAILTLNTIGFAILDLVFSLVFGK